MAGSLTVTSSVRCTPAASTTAEAVAQVFAGEDPADFIEVHFRKNCATACGERVNQPEPDYDGLRSEVIGAYIVLLKRRHQRKQNLQIPVKRIQTQPKSVHPRDL